MIKKIYIKKPLFKKMKIASSYILKFLTTSIGIILLIFILVYYRYKPPDPLDIYYQKVEIKEESSGAANELKANIYSENNNFHAQVKILYPRPIWQITKPLPLFFILAGFETGIEVLDQVSQQYPSEILLATIEYPLRNEYFQQIQVLKDLPSVEKLQRLRDSFYWTLAAIHGGINWIKEAPAFDRKKFYLAGISYGSSFTTIAASQEAGINQESENLNGLVLAFSFARYKDIIPGVMRFHQLEGYKSEILKILLEWQLQPLDPEQWITQISNQPAKLFINADQDSFIPKDSFANLVNACKGNNQQIILEGENHLEPGNISLQLKLINIIAEFFELS